MESNESGSYIVDHVASGDGYLSEAGSPLRRPRQFLRETRKGFLISCRIAPRLTARALRSQYRSSFLGYFWLLGTPIAISFTWLYLTSAGVISGGETPIPYGAYVVTGILLWTSFVEAVSTPLARLLEAANLLNKVNFPPEAVIVSGSLTLMLNSLIRLVILVPVFLVTGVRPGWSIILAPLGVGALLLFGFSVGLILAPFGALYRDIGEAIPVVLYFFFFLTPVAYTLNDDMPGGHLIRNNPITPVLDPAREWLTGGSFTIPLEWMVMLGVSTILLAIGWVVFRVAMPHLVDRINV